METVLRKDALTETYIDIENLVYDAVWRFKARYGGDFDELAAEANLIYVLAFDSYNETKGAFSTWLCFCIRKGLLDFLNHIKQQNRYGVTFRSLSKAEGNVASTSHLFEMLEEVSQDTKTLIRLVFYPPEGITEEDLEKGFSARKTRVQLKICLQHRLGWSKKRISESFGEVRRVLNDRAV